MHWVIEDGKRKRRSRLKLILLSLRNRAAEGDVRAIRATELLADKYGLPEPSRPKQVIYFIDNGRDVCPTLSTDSEA